jgi:hypothetical protein
MNAESVSGMSIKGAEEDSGADTDASPTSEEEEEEEEEEAAETGVNPCLSNLDAGRSQAKQVTPPKRSPLLMPTDL